MTNRKIVYLAGFAAAAVLAGAGAGIAFASIPAPGGVIHGCYDKHGTLRVIDSANASCSGSETALDWNQVGPQGPSGAGGAVAYVHVLADGTFDAADSLNISNVTWFPAGAGPDPDGPTVCLTLTVPAHVVVASSEGGAAWLNAFLATPAQVYSRCPAGTNVMVFQYNGTAAFDAVFQ